MKRIDVVQALRGVAALAVVAFHAQFVEHKYAVGTTLLPDVLHLGRTGVDLFFVISGFVMVTVTRGRYQFGLRQVPRFLWSRLTRIYPVYWFYFALFAAAFLLHPAWVNASQGHQFSWLRSFFLLPDHHLPLVMVAWSLIHELWFYLVFALFLALPRRWLPWELTGWALVIIVAALTLSAADLSPGLRVALHPYSLEFIAGAFAALFWHQQRIPHLPKSWALGLIVAVLAVGLPLIYQTRLFVHPDLLRALVIGGFYALLVVALVTLESAGVLRVPRFLGRLGDMSYTVYLSHLLVLGAIGHLWAMIGPWPQTRLDNLIVVTVMLVAVVTCGWWGYRLVERPLINWSHRTRTRLFAAPSVDGASASRVEERA